jgi:hypothetical protein
VSGGVSNGVNASTGLDACCGVWANHAASLPSSA